MPRNTAISAEAREILERLTPRTPIDQAILMDELDWTANDLEAATMEVRRLGIALDTREDRIRLPASEWEGVCRLVQ